MATIPYKIKELFKNVWIISLTHFIGNDTYIYIHLPYSTTFGPKPHTRNGFVTTNLPISLLADDSRGGPGLIPIVDRQSSTRLRTPCPRRACGCIRVYRQIAERREILRNVIVGPFRVSGRTMDEIKPHNDGRERAQDARRVLRPAHTRFHLVKALYRERACPANRVKRTTWDVVRINKGL